MAKSKETRRVRPASTPEGREQQLISLAVDEAERQMREGTASSQIICHYLKLASPTAKIERDILQNQRDLLAAKTAALKAQEETKVMYDEVIKAMKRYSGGGDDEDCEEL